jgi:hypothetical protein
VQGQKSCKHEYAIRVKNLGGVSFFMKCSHCGKYKKDHLSCRKVCGTKVLAPRRSRLIV